MSVRRSVGSALAFMLACAGPDPSSELTEETGEVCTGEACDSTLTLTLTHSLDLVAGPHSITIVTPLFDLECSVPPETSGAKSCFGFRFADLEWNESTITIRLTEPFYDTDLNPDSEPFETVEVEVMVGGTTLLVETLIIEPGAPARPDPCGPICWPAVGATVIE